VGRQDVDRAVELARALQEASGEAAPPRLPAPVPDPVHRFDEVVDDDELRSFVRQLFVDGHYGKAVEEGFIFLNNLVRRRSGMTNVSGSDASMLTTVFSEKTPKLRLSRDLRSQSAKDRQQGYMRMFEGATIGVRNPRAHTHGHPDDPRNALELLAFCNHLVRTTRGATRTRGSRKPKSP
jgi:uncharacterized protein (TIGR02391 family)